MNQNVRVLLVEDSEDDAELVLRILRGGGFVPVALRVDNAAALKAALQQPWDVVISDFRMPGFTGLDALKICRSGLLDTPFILMSGAIGEEIAVAAMKAGANDYVMKQNLTRLAPALVRELQEAGMRAQHRSLQLQLIESERRFTAFMDASPIIASIKDEAGRYLYMNKGWDKSLGLKNAEWIGKTAFDVMPAEVALEIRKSELEVLKRGLPQETITEGGKPGPAATYLKNIRFPFVGASGQKLIGAFSIDITKEKQAEKTIHNLAYLDPLTELPNRRMMLSRLKRALATSARSRCHGALLFIDLDHFKTLNDTRGHDVGDRLLQQISQRLVACVREEDTVARTGGDEFVIILEGLSVIAQEAGSQVETIAKKILASISKTFMLCSQEHQTTASIGITLFCDRQNSTEELMKRADLAMYRVKASGRNALNFFDPEMQATVSARALLEADLRQGLEKDQFLLYYQPQVDSEGALTGVEALLRLKIPERGLIMPATFIPMAEETGLIVQLGYWVLETACRQLLAWSVNGATRHLTISVNVSSRQFHLNDFVQQVLDILERTGAEPRLLMLELTESVLLDEIEVTIEKMTALKQKGLNFSLDDFGTGYSSLYYLKRLPLYELKIDKSFVQDVFDDPNDAAIARAILSLGQSLGLTIIAEGVETLAQRDFLSMHGCNRFQGYLFGRPVPIGALDLTGLTDSGQPLK